MALGIDRVGREIEAEGLALGGHALGQVQRRRAAGGSAASLLGPAAEQAMLAAGALVVRRGGMGEDRLGRGEDRGRGPA